ncbi:MAG: Cof-type HAD-IIB family hydrolase [Hungatella hathewayi]|nr:Cof-type HAD-IIB family hydrolase [Hungatella hathewayi]
MIKAIFFDIDGTLLSHTCYHVPESTLKALEMLKQNGIKTFIASGRHASEMKKLPLNIDDFEGFVTLNGQYCYNNERVIYDLPIDKGDLMAMVEDIKQNRYPCIFVEEDRMYINYNDDYVQMVQDAISTPLPEIGDINRVGEREIYQLIPYVTAEQEEHILSLMPNSLPTRWHELAIDIIPAKGGKQNGIRKMIEYYNIPREEIMAIGDGENDLDMMEFAGISVAMGNAVPSVKAAADYVTDDVDHDGIYNALKHFNLI